MFSGVGRHSWQSKTGRHKRGPNLRVLEHSWDWERQGKWIREAAEVPTTCMHACKVWYYSKVNECPSLTNWWLICSILQYSIEPQYDYIKFIKLIQKKGMYVTLRVGPFIQAEWNHGYALLIIISFLKCMFLTTLKETTN